MKVRRKEIVEAYSYSGDPKNPGWPQGWLKDIKFSETGDKVYVKTHRGDIWVTVGGWIVQDNHGHIHFCRPQVFEEMYEAVNGVRAESMFGTQLEAAAKTVHDLFYAYCTKTFVTGLRRPEGEDPMLDKVVDALNQLHVMLNREKSLVSGTGPAPFPVTAPVVNPVGDVEKEALV